MATIETTPRPTYVYDGATDTWYPIGGVSYANIRIYEYTATASQTTFSGADLNGTQLDYTPNSIIVSLNGVALAPGDDYTATTGNTIVLTSPAAANDLLMITAFSTFNIADTYTQSEINTRLASKADSADVEGAATGLFYKTDFASVAFTKTGAGTLDIKAGTKVWVNDTVVTYGTATAVTMPTLTAGTDYFIYVEADATISAVAATGTWPTPVAAPPADSRLIGGFHYAPGGNASGTSGGDTTPAINEYSMWDVKWRPAAPDPRGMTLVNDHFWSDIYLLNTTASTNGTSANDKTIYDTQTWWDTAEELGKYGKRPPRYTEFCDLAYGTTEAQSRGNDPVTTGFATTNTGSSNTDEEFTSKWGVIQATGVEWVWGNEFGGGNAAASWSANTGGRGSTYQLENAVLFGGRYNDTVNTGSRTSNWNNSLSNIDATISGRGVCDHLRLV